MNLIYEKYAEMAIELIDKAIDQYLTNNKIEIVFNTKYGMINKWDITDVSLCRIEVINLVKEYYQNHGWQCEERKYYECKILLLFIKV